MVDFSFIFLVSLYLGWKGLRKRINVTITSPYKAQLAEIRDKLGQKYRSYSGFTVKVIEIDQLQGNKEEDVIILSTVRSNSDGLVRLFSDPQKVSVVFTSAR